MKTLLLAATAATLGACGQTGDLYLPDSRQGTVVTRPPPAETGTQAPSTTGTVDSPPQPTAPAPEVAPPPGTKDKKNGTQPPPK